ncbi:Ultraviolet-B receptor UVR8 [Acorus gramineus]|uniref:Ultraviolet-B receptor UVR8 n=1 Tax=Acorus gramineus TaxID=55184 RepID=A0AAV9AF57_ACOGR|nr:Ultraviolet-B receptor UVR8 [Acorus gramineus]
MAEDATRDLNAVKALIALKKGTQLTKYSRKGKPKFCLFRISTDETTLIWYSHGEERNLKLATVCRIIPGQRTAVFKRYLRPEKDYLSFSLLYKNGERSLDLICKDKVEAELWISGLKSLISTGQLGRSRLDREIDVGSEDISSYIPNGHSSAANLEVSSLSRRVLFDIYSQGPSFKLARSDAGSDCANMQLRTSIGDGSRLSVSSAPSSSGSSWPDDCESLGEVYFWGEVWVDGDFADGSSSPFRSRTDVLLPKPLESDLVLDVHQIACGVSHAALVTRQGEVFTWGEEHGGRLGLGIDSDVCRPQLVESLSVHNVDYIACGEYHTCAISVSGDLFTWGDGAHNAGLLGHGTDVSHWIPKRVSGLLEGLQVLSVACGTWHSALITSNGKLFTFGDGNFGALGHGDRESISYPKEVEFLSELKTIKVACGMWHSAAIVEGKVNGANSVYKRLFTWGDGDKYRLGLGDKETRLVPTFVPSLTDYNFHQVACGQNMTIALTTSGHVFTMGSTVYGQLGNPQADGRMPCLVQDRLAGEKVEDIACGAYHVAVLTSRSEIFTWGRGANGRLGHGDIDDRRAPTLVEALKDRHVKSISCGSSFTASICIHKWVSGADQSVCSGCRQAFGFTRKRHNCYNCGLVHCHACSSTKALKAALAPTPGKPYRVCDSCFAKLKAAETGNASTINRRNMIPRCSMDTRERSDGREMRSSRILLSPETEPVKYVEVKSTKQGMKSESLSLMRAPQVPALLLLKDISFPSSLSALQTALKPIITSTSAPVNSRPTSPYSRRASPTRSTTPIFSKSIIDSLKITNEHLNQEVLKLQAEVKSLKQRREIQDMEMHGSIRKAQDSSSLTVKESKYNVAKEVSKSLAEQLKDMAEKLPPDFKDKVGAMRIQAESLLENGMDHEIELSSSTPHSESRPRSLSEGALVMQDNRTDDSINSADFSQDAVVEGTAQQSNGLTTSTTSEAMAPQHNSENGSRSPTQSASRYGGEGEGQLVEQFEPGVYVTLVQLRNGTKNFKRVRFSKRRFAEQQAEEWWRENKERVYRKYNYSNLDNKPAEPPSTSAPPEEDGTASSSRPE